MNVAVADDPAHSASRKPRLTTSRRPPARMSFSVGATSESTTFGVTTSAEAASSRSSICRDGVVADDVAEVAQRPEQPDQQRRDGEHLPERGLGRQPEDAVLPRLGQRLAEHLQRGAHERRPVRQPAALLRLGRSPRGSSAGRAPAGCGGLVVRTPSVPGGCRGAAGQDGAHPPSVHGVSARRRRSAATCRTASLPRGTAQRTRRPPGRRPPGLGGDDDGVVPSGPGAGAGGGTQWITASAA